MISLKGLRGAVPNPLYVSKTPFKRMAAVRRVLFWYGGQFEGVWKEGGVGCQWCQVGRPMPYASKESQPNICRVRRTMIMSETDLRISKVPYISSMNVIVIFFCFCKLILFLGLPVIWGKGLVLVLKVYFQHCCVEKTVKQYQAILTQREKTWNNWHQRANKT